MKNLFSLLLLLTIIIAGCDDDDGIPQFVGDPCTVDAAAQNCTSFSELTVEEVQERLTGEWELIARGGGFIICEEIPVAARTNYNFDGDSTLVITRPDGTAETGNYYVSIQCGIVPPCWISVEYSDNFMAADRPLIFNTCDNGLSISDATAIDGQLLVYQKTN